MVRLFTAAGADGVSKLMTGDPGVVSRWLIDVTEPSAAVFSLKFKGRASGRGQPAPAGDGLGGAAADFTAYLPIKNRNTDAAIAAATGITDTGLYEVDTAGLEAVAELDWTSGSVTVVAVPLLG